MIKSKRVYVLGSGINQSIHFHKSKKEIYEPPISKNFFNVALRMEQFIYDYYDSNCKNLSNYIQKYWKMSKVTLETIDESQAKTEALRKIGKSLSKICFAYNTEALIKKDGLYLIDLTNRPNVETVQGSLVLRWGYLEENSEDTITKIRSLTEDKKSLLDLALAYYRLGYYDNPLRIECYFSCLTVLIRNISHCDYVSTNTLRKQTKLILKKRNTKFDERRFDKEWNECYADERCSISHGRGSKLIDVSKSNEYQKMVSTVGHWTREVIYFFIDNNQGTDKL